MRERLWKTFQELSEIYSPSFGEREFCDALCCRLNSLNIHFFEDNAAKIIQGNCGNLICTIPGTIEGSPLLFSAHLDTVEPAQGKQVVLHENGDITSAGDTILGADDVSGIVIILEAITRLKEQKIPHRTIELVFPVAEEQYGAGSAVIDYQNIHSKEAYVLDLSGNIGEAANTAPTILSFDIQVFGKAAHAGFAPKEGIHAILVTANAIARLPQGEPYTGLTFNIGEITGGEATNIVPAFCNFKGEIRSLDHTAVLSYWEIVKSVFIEEANKLGAKIEAHEEIKIQAYQTPLDSPVIKRFAKACEKTGIKSNIHSTFGGSDQNNFAKHGIEGLVIACSMHEVHSVREHSNLSELEDCVRLVMELMTDREDR